jgi:hypothetical protein
MFGGFFIFEEKPYLGIWGKMKNPFLWVFKIKELSNSKALKFQYPVVIHI